MKKAKAKKGLSNSQHKAGILFCLPFIIGILLFYILPLINSVLYSFSDVKLSENGIDLTFKGIEYYNNILFKDPDFIRNFATSIGSIAYQIPIIILFSLFIGIMINHKFRGRTIVRGIFFLPVIIGGSIIISIMTGEVYSAVISGGQSTSTLMQSTVLKEMLSIYGLRQDLIDFIVGTVDKIFELTWRSGVQILLFLAALQSIPSSLYEASSIEGANAWENFWFITLPIISPVLLVNGVYTLIDTFVDYSNPVMRQILDLAGRLNYSVSSAMAWTYFIVIALIMGILFLIIRKRIFYEV